ncbi:MAG: ribosome biogenesis GTP-binding protein YihA/YsxC [Candidatus Accumulibacter sp.]|jgi:GTP-binding protein|nr:ribosome biogenesis GTP-binding protein YihA/YsxC [Accumulibacter sp.]
MSLFQKAAFYTTVAHLRDLPPESLREVAFAGRSNAGKSSAINVLANQTRLAFVSKTPGRTQNLNYFSLGDGRFFVDLPGYGYAKAPKEIRAQWEGLLAPYLIYRNPLVGLVLIMDSRRPLTDLDQRMIGWFSQTGKPIHILLTKADKLTRRERAETMTKVNAALMEMKIGASAQFFSSLKREGIAEAEEKLCEWLEIANDPRAATAPEKLEKVTAPRVARPKNRSAKGWSAR